VDQYIDSSGTVVLRFKNLFDANITVVGAEMFDEETETFIDIYDGPVDGSGEPVNIPLNEIGRVEFDIDDTPTESRKERVRMIITFRRQGGTIEHSLAGTIFGEVSEPLSLT
jgi:hypothetical protein